MHGVIGYVQKVSAGEGPGNYRTPMEARDRKPPGVWLQAWLDPGAQMMSLGLSISWLTSPVLASLSGSPPSPTAQQAGRRHCTLTSDILQQTGATLNFFFNVYFIFERETEHEQGRGKERGRHRIRSRLQAPGSELSAQSPTRGSISQTARS